MPSKKTEKQTDSTKKIEQEILKIAIKITKKGYGALFVIGNKLKYSRLLNQKFKEFNVLDKGAGKVLEGIATIDGAIIINKKGIVKDYGAMIKNVRTFKGYGTRHSAGLTASKNNNVSILCSEEEKKVKIFKNGKYVMQIDALEKGIEKSTSSIATMLETIGAGFLGSIGAVTLAPTIGIALIPGVIIFGGSYYTIKKILEKYKII
jgi:DNA integrity scanning protein DisA with diadenylate cyclase activity